eukprot:CAMPEP_0205904522 /NCGR_PEP_ID=MMETSP1325-20131115/774_1 /ASSEMBLY_ACC=CAM_ASM_000708 /TAXON_ID=236786 /ORGANISM="Florenciella sp., Strain RCC1007" /LENGTH=266 /DNA_ID=CAMNT_0053270307 /DNA_START=52 /DNA_END=852 /DNA_ORIENTATION=+
MANPQEDPYYWAQRNGLYMKQEELVALLRDPVTRAQTLVVDTRDDDRGGGHIAGSLHAADGSFDAAAVHATAAAPPRATRVVFHCMESARRGPRCAYRLKEYLIEQRIVGEYQISVLQGGADQWVRRFHADAALVHGFDNEYWGFYPFEGEDGETGAAGAEAEAAAAAPMHVLYERPRDQPATPWSECGSEAVPHGATMIAGDSGDNGGHGAGARPCSPPLTSSAASAESATQLQADVLAWRAEPATGASSQVAVVGADAGAEAGT